MSETFEIKRDSTSPAISQQLLDGDGAAVDITGASVTFKMSKRGAVAVNAAATITDAATGTVTYNWIAADTANAGLYRIEWEVTYSGGAVEVFPAYGYNSVYVSADL